MTKDIRTYDLEERLIDFAVRICYQHKHCQKKQENFIILNFLFDIRHSLLKFFKLGIKYHPKII